MFGISLPSKLKWPLNEDLKINYFLFIKIQNVRANQTTKDKNLHAEAFEKIVRLLRQINQRHFRQDRRPSGEITNIGHPLRNKEKRIHYANNRNNS